MQRYFTLQIFECFDKTLGHSKKCNVISLCKYLSAFIYLLTTCGLRLTYLMVCACVDACTHFFAGTQFYALHLQYFYLVYVSGSICKWRLHTNNCFYISLIIPNDTFTGYFSPLHFLLLSSTVCFTSSYN